MKPRQGRYTASRSLADAPRSNTIGAGAVAMKTVLFSLGAMALVCSSTLAGIVRFDPPNAVIDRTSDETTAVFDLSIKSAFATIGSVDMVVGSETLLVNSWTPPPNWYLPFCYDCPPLPEPADIYPSDLRFGAFTFVPQATPFSFGSLTVRLPDLLSPGTYEVIVDAVRDANRSKLAGGSIPPGQIEPLFGSVTLTVIPEPATFVLTAIALAACLPRCRHGKKEPP